MGLTCEVYAAGCGIGDAVWVSALVGTRLETAPRVVFVDDRRPGGLAAFRNIRLWAAAAPAAETDLPAAARDPAWTGWQDLAGSGPLTFDRDWLRARPPLPGRPYTVVQPATCWHKGQSLKPRDVAGRVVLIGGAGDRVAEWPGATLDLRGELSIADAMWVVAHAERVVGCESWPALLAALCGVPAVMEAFTRATADELRRVFGGLIPFLQLETPC